MTTPASLILSEGDENPLTPPTGKVTLFALNDHTLNTLNSEGVATTLKGDSTYVHTQGAPSTTWTINHNLGKYPAVTVVDSANDKVGGEVNYPSENQVVLTFSAALSGRAFFS